MRETKRFQVAQDVAVRGSGGGIVRFRFAIVDTEADTVEYVASRAACREWAAKLNNPANDGARAINADHGPHYPIIREEGE